MNEDRNPAWALELDTDDTVEAIQIAAVLYANWRDMNEDAARSPDGPKYLRHAGGHRYLEVAGYLPEPQIAFRGTVQSLTRFLRQGESSSQTLSPLAKCIWNRLLNRDDDDDPANMGELAEYLREEVAVENEERFGHVLSGSPKA